MKKILGSSVFAFSLVFLLNAIPPAPPEGMRWVLQDLFSDEFNGDELDLAKWNDYYPGWQGRAPAKFLPKAVSVSDGMMQIKNGVMEEPEGPYTIYGGAVTSKLTEAHLGYYECRTKASKINMSTTFWMSNGKVSFDETKDCPHDKYSQELDIQEAVGGSKENPGFRTEMHSNTHYRYIACGETKEKFYSKGARKVLKSEVSEDFHTYAAWWMNEDEVRFYADDEFFESVKITKEISEHPFNRPMHINMVTETYNWQPAPTHEDLLNDEINTSYYDWIRSYRLVKVDEKVDVQSDKEIVKIYDESVFLEKVPNSIFSSDSEFSVQYRFQANEDRELLIEVLEWHGKKKEIIQAERLPAYAGFGRGEYSLKLTFSPESGSHYSLKASLVGLSETKKPITLDWVSFDVSE